MVTGTKTSNGDQKDSFGYSGSGDYTTLGSDYMFGGTITEGGGDDSTSKYDIHSTFLNAHWTDSGTSSGTWDDKNDWKDKGNGSYMDTFSGGYIGGTLKSDDGEERTNSGAWDEEVGSNNKWSLTSGHGTATDNLHGEQSYLGTGGFSSIPVHDLSNHSATVRDAIQGTLYENGDKTYHNKSTVNSGVQNGAWVLTGSGMSDSTEDGGWDETDNGNCARSDEGISNWISGTDQGNAQQRWSSHFHSDSVLHADGSVTKTGTGTSDDSGRSGFSFSGGGSTPALVGNDPAIVASGTIGFTESGSGQSGGDLHGDFILDPNGSWRVASQDLTQNGQTSGFYDKTMSGYAFWDGGSRVSGGHGHEESRYHFSRDLITLTDAAGHQTKSGTGSGGGTASGISSLNDVTHDFGTEKEYDNLERHDYNYEGSWNENYATGAASATGGNDQTGNKQLITKVGGEVETSEDVPYPPSRSTEPGFGSGPWINHYYKSEASFNTTGGTSFGRQIPSVTVQAPSKVTISHGVYTTGPYTTPQRVKNWQIGIAAVGGASLFGAAGLVAYAGVTGGLSGAYAAVFGGAGAAAAEEDEVETAIREAAEAIEDYLGDGYTINTSPTSDLYLKSADGTRSMRFDISNSHGLDPHINIEAWEPRNLYPGDTRMIQIMNEHIFLRP